MKNVSCPSSYKKSPWKETRCLLEPWSGWRLYSVGLTSGMAVTAAHTKPLSARKKEQEASQRCCRTDCGSLRKLKLLLAGQRM